MTELSRPWQDGVGDGGPYSDSDWALILETVALAVGANVGVVPSILNELAVTSPSDNTLRINTGRALVEGIVYENGASEDLNSNSPAVGTTGRRVVLRADYTARTVRLTIISSSDGTASLPALTQTAGVTWEIPLASFTITTGGVIGALTSEREWTQPDRVITVRKAAEEVVNNSAALQDDDDFLFAIGANEVWIVDIYARVQVGASDDLQFTFTLPAGASMMGIGFLESFSGGTAHGGGRGTTPGTGIEIEVATAGSTGELHIHALLANSVTAGTAQFQWAQRVAVVIDTKIFEDAYMIARRIA